MSGARQISFEDAPFSAIHKKITAGTFMGQISDAYTLGIVGISLNYAMEPLGLTSFWMGLIGAGSMFGIFFGSLLAGITADKIGRRPLYASLMLLTAIVSVLQFFLSDPLLIAIVRFVLGMLIGADYTVGIPLLSEWAPAKKRAGILGWLLVFWTIGYCISYIVGFFMDGFVAAFGNDGWRLVLCTSVVPSLIALVIRFGTPESPLWHIAKGRPQEALANIHAYLGNQYGLPDRGEDGGVRRILLCPGAAFLCHQHLPAAGAHQDEYPEPQRLRRAVQRVHPHRRARGALDIRHCNPPRLSALDLLRIRGDPYCDDPVDLNVPARRAHHDHRLCPGARGLHRP